MSRETPKAGTKKTVSALRRYWLPVVLVVALILMTITPFAWRALNCFTYEPEYMNDRQLHLSTITVKLEEVTTKERLEQGLSGRPCLPRNQGMLFTFSKPGKYAFWMKDMKFPIDILWLDKNKKIVHAETNVSPDSYPQTFVNKQPAKYVLELKAGMETYYGLGSAEPLNF